MYLEVGVTLYYPMLQARVHLLSKMTVEVLTLFSLAVIFLVHISMTKFRHVIPEDTNRQKESIIIVVGTY